MDEADFSFNKHQKLVFVSAENENGEGIIMINKYLRLLELNWKDWKIKYLTEGYTDVIRFLSGKNYFKDNLLLQSIENYIPNYLKDIWDEPKGTLISKDVEGKISYEYVNQNIAELISQGEKLLDKYLKNQIPDDKIPFGGIL